MVHGGTEKTAKNFNFKTRQIAEKQTSRAKNTEEMIKDGGLSLKVEFLPPNNGSKKCLEKSLHEPKSKVKIYTTSKKKLITQLYFHFFILYSHSLFVTQPAITYSKLAIETL